MVSNTCYEVLANMRAQSVCALNSLAGETTQLYCRTRVARIVNDHIPSSKGLSHSGLVRYYSSLTLNTIHECEGDLRSSVTSQQKRAFFRKLLARVFPDELIGAANWSRLLDNALRSLGDLHTRSQIFPYAQLSNGIRYEEIRWLDGVQFGLKSLVAKNLLQFISRFILNIIR